MSLFGFLKPAHQSKDPEVRLKAVQNIHDESQLAELAMNDKSPRVRNAAVRKVVDQNLLMKIALDGQDIVSRIAAVDRIESQEKLAQIIKTRKNYQLMGACFSRITDRNILEKIANDTEYNRSARRIAIEQYADESYLAEFENNSTTTEKPKSKEEIDAIINLYGGERLVHALGKFRGSKSSITALGEVMRRGGDAAKTAVEHLAKALVHTNPDICKTAEEQLVTISDPDLIAHLVSMIYNDELHEKIIYILQNINHPDAKEILKKHI